MNSLDSDSEHVAEQMPTKPRWQQEREDDEFFRRQRAMSAETNRWKRFQEVCGHAVQPPGDGSDSDI